MSLPDAKMFVSSANSLGCNLVAFAMSFTYNVKRMGPRTDPCGTPVFIISRLELHPLTW